MRTRQCALSRHARTVDLVYAWAKARRAYPAMPRLFCLEGHLAYAMPVARNLWFFPAWPDNESHWPKCIYIAGAFDT